MKEVTAVRPGRNRKMMDVYLDGKRTFSLAVGTVVKTGLAIGKGLSENEIESLKQTDRFQRCLDAAMRLLSYRPRSEFELKERLRQKGVDSEDIEAVMGRLREQRLIDDAEFARFWKENRNSFRPRSQRLIRLELMRKKVPEDVIEEVAGDIDDDENAYRVALGKARKLPPMEYREFHLRLGEHLRRRGFSYEVAGRAADKLWQELKEGTKA